MASSLAKQLAAGASLNSAFLVDRSRRKPVQSYLFTSREADQHDLDSIHALGVNGFQRLNQIDAQLFGYEDVLFSATAKATDRTLQTAEANAKLDATIGAFLPLLGPYLLESPTTNVIEWLVRRFRIHEFNVDLVLAVFMPYHESAHFLKMLSILHIPAQSKFSPLLPYKSTSSPLSHTAFVDILAKPNNAEFARFVGSLLPSALRLRSSVALHRGLIAFHTGVLMDYVKKKGHAQHGSGVLDEGSLAWFLQSIMEPLHIFAGQDAKGYGQALVAEAVLSSYLLLSALSHTCPLSSDALSAIQKAVASCSRHVSSTQVLRTLASICAPQALASDSAVPKSVVKSILKFDGVEQELRSVLKFSGTERFVVPLTKGFMGRLAEDRAIAILTAIVTCEDMPRSIIRLIADELVQQSLDDVDEALQARRRALLINLQQRHPAVLQMTFRDLLEENRYEKSIVEQQLLSLSLTLPDGVTVGSSSTAPIAGQADLVLATVSADATVRTSAIRSLYEHISKEQLNDAELTSIQLALLARVQDISSSVLEALYSSPDHLLPVLLTNAPAYISTVSDIIHSQTSSPTRGVLRAHLSFLISHVYAKLNPNAKTQVVQELLFPLLLLSKLRHKTATLVWELIESSEHADIAFGGLRGCVEAVKWEGGKASGTKSHSVGENVETMANINIALATKLAEDMQTSKDFSSHLAFVISHLHGKNPHARALAYLVCRALLTQLSGSRRISVGHDILQAMGLDSLEFMNDFVRSTDDFRELLSDHSLGTAIVLKPTKPSTLHRLQVTVLSVLASIPRPAGTPLDWLATQNVSTSTVDTSGATKTRYNDLQQSLYSLANSTAALPVVSTHIIQTQLTNIGSDVLQFLASVWLYCPDNTFNSAQLAALRHAAAYLEAHYSSQRHVDFQLVLPALLVPMSSATLAVRQAAYECIAALVRLAQAKKPEGVYAFDSIYGSGSASLQYLEWQDFCKYIQALQQARGHVLNDHDYLPVVHQQLLTVSKADGKKETGYKQRVLSYLLSHANCGSPEVVKLVVLRCLRGVSSSAKFQKLLPSLETSVDTAIAGHDLSTLLLSSADDTAAKSLNDDTGSAWVIYTKILRHYFQSGSTTTLRDVLTHGLQSGLFSKLRPDRQVELCKIVLEISQQTLENASACRDLLSSLNFEVPVIVSILTSLRPLEIEAGQRMNKRPRIDSDSVHDSYASLTLFLEVLGAAALPGSPELVATLLDTLNFAIHDTSVSASDKTYAVQLLLSALENAVSNVTANLPLPAVRIDTLVELIRVSENPQTFHQALLLIASFAKLVPSAIVQTIMPVFTFMGSNVFHRDDAYSFKVVQKTIDNIVPVMIESLKQSQPEKLELQIAARDFLHVFVDAAHHIPRHRRVSFFSHLVEVLGPQEFLAPLCLLITDKVSNRVIRQSPEDVLASLSLPLSLLQRSNSDVQIPTLVELVEECSRLIDVACSAPKAVKTFLEAPIDDERGGSSGLPKKQAQAVMIFVSLALQQMTANSAPSRGLTSDLLALLLDVAVAREEQLRSASMEAIVTLAREAVGHALKVMSAKDFITGVQRVLESEQSMIQRGALGILAEELPNVTDKVRQDSRAIMVKIVEAIRSVLQAPSPDELVQVALSALGAVSSTMNVGEEYVLTTTVPIVIKKVQQRQTAAPSLSALLNLIHKLGPRIIPFFKDLVKECTNVLSDDASPAHAEATSVLHALLTSIPNFWSSGDILLIIELYLRSDTTADQRSKIHLTSFVKTLAKRGPSKILLPTLGDSWTRLAASEPAATQVSGFLFVARRVIQHSDKATLPEYLRALFKTFLDILSLCSSSEKFKAEVESEAIAAFVELVVKMNEATFKPLFRRLFDWAFTTSEAGDARKTVFLHLYTALLDYFKSLMTPYMGFLLQPVVELLGEFKRTAGDLELRQATIHTLAMSFVHDEGAFWREDKLRQLITPLIAQLPGCSSNATELRDSLNECLIALVEAMNDPTSLKSANLELLMHTRSDDSRVRTYALSCAEALWRSHGGKLIGFAPETATFVAECAEDDNDSVVREAHRLKNAVENIAGRIDV